MMVGNISGAPLAGWVFDTWGDKVIAISGAVKDHLERDLGVRKDRIELIYSGVDAARFAKAYSDAEIDAIRNSLCLKRGPVAGTIGRLSRVKGHRHLVEAMAGIVAEDREAQCLIVGDGEEKSALEDLARKLGIRDAIRFVSSGLDTPRLLAAMDVFVFPSIREGLGIALLEAMAAGKACVASDTGGIRDIITGPSCGILVPVGDSKAMAEAVTSLFGDKALRRSMGDSARRLASGNFSLDAMTGKVIELYKEVLHEKE